MHLRTFTGYGYLQLLLLACLSLTFAAHLPLSNLQPRIYSQDPRNFAETTSLVSNLRSCIRTPFSAITNVGLQNYAKVLDVSPTNLKLLPPRYCFSKCANPKNPNPFTNEMAELNPEKLIVVCAVADGQGQDWPFMKACQAQEEVLRNFLVDLCSHGSSLAIAKDVIEKAAELKYDRYRCMPADPQRSTFSAFPLSTPIINDKSTSMRWNIQAFESSIYKKVASLASTSWSSSFLAVPTQLSS